MLRAGIVPTVLGASALAFVGLRGNAKQETAAPPVVPTTQVLNIQDDFEKVAETLRPSVVSIMSRETVKNSMVQQERQQGVNPFTFQFPNAPGQGAPQFRMMPQQQSPQHAMASGSGVIVRKDGYILTNDHVVADADRVTVRLLDGREFVGKVMRDPKSDLAVVKIDANDLPVAQLANSDDVHIGQWALAFGSPFTLNDTMTVGVISSLKRSETIGDGNDVRYYPSLLQTDASINPGNSGGPLADVYGRVVGIDVAIESPNGGNVGIGFAIPANTARYIMDQLISKGSVTRGYLGLVPRTLSYNDQQQYGVKQGVLVNEVQDGTPAAQAGLQVQDVITRFGDKPVTDEAQFRDMISRTDPGTKVSVTVRRDGAERTIDVTVGSLPADKPQAQIEQPQQKARGKLGISIGDLSDPNVRQQLQQENLKPAGEAGVVIEDITPESPAAEAGLNPGDVILRINGKTVTSPQQLADIAGSLTSGSRVPVIVRRQGAQGVTGTFLATVEID